MRVALEGEHATILVPLTPQLADTIVELYHKSASTLMKYLWAQQACLENENWRAYEILEAKIITARKSHRIVAKSYASLLFNAPGRGP